MDEAAKAGLRQIDEEGSTTELPLSTTHLHDAENNEEKAQEELKRELNFSELWGKHYWRQFTSITPGMFNIDSQSNAKNVCTTLNSHHCPTYFV